MTKTEYLEQLRRKLRAMPENELQDALEYYDGYLSDAEDEGAAMALLGSPGEVAANILINHAAEEPAAGGSGQSAGKAGAKGIRAAWMVALVIFALPVGLPLVMVLAALAFSLTISIVITVGAIGLGLLSGGVVGLVFFPMVVLQDAGTALLFLGQGLASLGFGILFIKFTAVLMKGFPMIARFVKGKIRNKIARRNRHGK